MNANYIYDIFQTCEDLDLPDLTIALAHHKEAHPIPEGMTEPGHQRVCGQPLRGPWWTHSPTTTGRRSPQLCRLASRRTRSTRPARRAEPMLICIDAGHYIGTPGKRCLKRIDPGETREWTLNRRVADRLEAILAGYDCQTMRVDDVTGRRDVTLSQRVAAANRAKADVYLSIHHNAGINGGSGGGIVAYVAPSHQKQSEVVRDAVYRYTVASTGLRGNRAQPLAEQSLYVLNYTTMPATLIELGFMDSTTDTPIILTEQFADQAAAGLAAALGGGV